MARDWTQEYFGLNVDYTTQKEGSIMEHLELNEFINNLTNDTQGYFSLAFLNEKPGTGIKTHKFFSDIDALKWEIDKYADDKRINLCLSPNTFKTKNRGNNNIEKLNAIFLDIDEKKADVDTLITQDPTPHYVFKRDDNHYHLYFLLEPTDATEENLEKAATIQNFLIDRYKADKGVKDIARVLRLPYTSHPNGHYELYTKYTHPKYNLDNLIQYVPKPEKPQKKQEKQTKQPTQNGNAPLTDDHIYQFLYDSYIEFSLKKGEGRSRFLYYLGLDAHKWGLDQQRAIHLGIWVNEFMNTPPEPERIVKHQILSAYKYTKHEFGERRIAAEQGGYEKQYKKYKHEMHLKDVLKSWVYIENTASLFNTKNGTHLTDSTVIGNFLAGRCGTLYTLKQILHNDLIKQVEYQDFRPDIDKQFYSKGQGHDITRYYNRFNSLKVYDKLSNSWSKELEEVFTDHLKYLTNNETEYDYLLKTFAYIIQNPGEKLNYATLIISKYQGIGKSVLETLFKNIFMNQFDTSYAGPLDNEQIDTNYTHYLADRIMCFVHELSQGDKYQAMNRFKNLITENTLEINAKYARPYSIKNTINFIMFSNDPAPVKLDKQDRRFFVIYNNKKPQNTEYYDKLWKTFEEDYTEIYNFLRNIDLSGFNPKVAPPITQGKQQVIDQSESELNIFLKDLEEEGSFPFDSEIVLPSEIQHAVMNSSEISPNVRNKISQKAIKNYLIAQGYVEEKVRNRIDGIRQLNKKVWFKEGTEITTEKLKQKFLGSSGLHEN